TFTTPSLNRGAPGHPLTASSGGLPGATSSAFTITAAAANHLAFGQQPTNTAAGASLSPAVTVQVLDAFNNLVTTDASSVTVALGSNPGGGTLSGTLTVAAVGGVGTGESRVRNKSGGG